METLLLVAIIITALSSAIQAGVLLAMFLLSRRVAHNVEQLAAEGQRLMVPLERVTANVKSASDDLVQIGHQANDAVCGEIQELRSRISTTVDEVHRNVMAPIREWSAIANGVSTGIRTFFSRPHTRSTNEEETQQTPAA
jgi:hypothetical protein